LRKSYKLFLGFCFLITPICCSSDKPLIFEPWNGLFSLRQTESNDTISVSGLFYGSGRIFIYNLAEGKMAVFSEEGKLVESVTLASIGRNTYVGDDFIVTDGRIVFLNTVDKTLEFFDQKSGRHLKSLPYPQDALNGSQSRMERFITGIFLEAGRIMLGNAGQMFFFDESTGTVAEKERIVSARPDEKLLLPKVVLCPGNDIMIDGRKKGKQPPTHYPVSGKRNLLLRGTLYALVLDKRGVSVLPVRQ